MKKVPFVKKFNDLLKNFKFEKENKRSNANIIIIKFKIILLFYEIF